MRKKEVWFFGSHEMTGNKSKAEHSYIKYKTSGVWGEKPPKPVSYEKMSN